MLAQPLSWLIGEVDPPYVKFISALWRGWYLTIVVLFYKVYLNTLYICLLWILSCVRPGNSLEGPWGTRL